MNEWDAWQVVIWSSVIGLSIVALIGALSYYFCERKMNRPCKCEHCQEMNKFFNLIKKYNISKDDEEFLEHIYMKLEAAETSEARLEAILNADWPNAKEYLEAGISKYYNQEHEEYLRRLDKSK
jgi:hypothetical protein